MEPYVPFDFALFLSGIDPRAIRGYVQQANLCYLTEVYNECLRELSELRTPQLNVTAAFIAKGVENPVDTSGPDFTHWLAQLINEIGQQ